MVWVLLGFDAFRQAKWKFWVDEYMMNRRAVSPGLTTAIRSLGERVRARLRASNKRGQSLVEMAVSLPLLLLILTGIMTFGIALNNYLTLTNAVEIGGQQLAVSRGQTTDPCNTAAQAIDILFACPQSGESQFHVFAEWEWRTLGRRAAAAVPPREQQGIW